MNIRFLTAIVLCCLAIGGCSTPEDTGGDRSTYRDQAEAKENTNPDVKEQESQPSGARGGR